MGINEDKLTMMSLYKTVATNYIAKLNEPLGKTALQYFKDRGLSDETIKRFGLGYAPYGRSNMFQILRASGYSKDILMDSTLFVNTDDGIKDKFYNRVIFPIVSEDNKVIAFGGRVLDDRKPKYINSNETIIFNKSDHLYAFNIAKNTKENYLILSEGYMDTISLHQAGFTNTVASLGTSLTRNQAALMKKYGFDNVIISYDSDEAGKKAALRAISILKEAGITTKVLTTAPYKDPDELIKAEGVEGYKKAISKAISSFEFEINRLEDEFDINAPEDTLALYKQIAEMIVNLPPEDRKIWEKKIVSFYELPESEWQKLFSRAEHNVNSFEKEFKKNHHKDDFERWSDLLLEQFQ